MMIYCLLSHNPVKNASPIMDFCQRGDPSLFGYVGKIGPGFHVDCQGHSADDYTNTNQFIFPDTGTVIILRHFAEQAARTFKKEKTTSPLSVFSLDARKCVNVRVRDKSIRRRHFILARVP